MLLEASKFEDYLDFHSGYLTEAFPKLEYALEGSAVSLRLIEARTYGGQVRLYLNTEGVPVNTGSTTTPMRVRRPFRLGPFSAYILHFHLSMKKLPDDVVAHIVPTEELAKLGMIFTDVYMSEGDLTCTVVPLRMIEVVEGYPLANLTFIPKACVVPGHIEGNDDTPRAVKAKATPKKTTASTKGKKNAKNPPNRA